MQKIIPNLWFNGNAKEAVDFYLDIFPNSKVLSTMYYPKSEAEGLASFQKDLAGEVLTIEFELNGMRFTAINADGTFTPNPSISIMVNVDPKYNSDAATQIDEMWEKLSAGGKVLMPIDAYPFSKRYGWVEDKYGFSWQLSLTDEKGEDRPPMIPSLLFVTDEATVTEEATDFYMSIFKDAKRGELMKYPSTTGNNKEGGVMFTDFTLSNQWFMAMDGSTKDHHFSFNEAVSLSVGCKDQAEIDYYWEKLSAGGEESVCGWLKDKYGVSWQVVPSDWEAIMKHPDAFKKMMGMKKLIIAELKGEE